MQSVRFSCTIVLLLLMRDACAAGVITFHGVDAGVAENDPRPNANTAAAAFEAAAAQRGQLNVIDFEGMRPVNPYQGPIDLPFGVTLIMATNASGGSGIIPSLNCPFVGFNTTPGGELYARLDTNSSQPTPFASQILQFDAPITAWGAFVTGLGNFQGIGDLTFEVRICQGISAPIVVETAFPDGGVLYFGLIAPQSFSMVELRMTSSDNLIHANMGLDDVSFVFELDPCPADVNEDQVVGTADLLAVLATWGQSGVPTDIDRSCAVNAADLLAVLDAWGLCP